MRKCKHNDYGECLECALNRVSDELDAVKEDADRLASALEGHDTMATEYSDWQRAASNALNLHRSMQEAQP